MNASVASSIVSSDSRATTYLGAVVAGRLLAHRAGRVDENRHRGAEPLFVFGLIGAAEAAVGAPALAPGSVLQLRARLCTRDREEKQRAGREHDGVRRSTRQHGQHR